MQITSTDRQRPRSESGTVKRLHASRAVRDALPLLQQSKDVAIAVVHPSVSERSDTQLADVAQYLRHHNVSVTKEIASVGDESEADMLLHVAGEEHVDMIVAGAYGRTRIGEWIFGGVTRDLLSKSPVCCFFSN